METPPTSSWLARAQPPSTAAFRQAFRCNAAGVWAVTAAHDGQRSGLTATSVVSLSDNPAELMVSIKPSASTYPLLQAAECFGVNLLTQHQQAVADCFAGRHGSQSEARYAQGRWHCSPQGVWLLEDAAVGIACQLEELIWRRTYALVIGRITHIYLPPSAPDTPEPQTLVYTHGHYTTVA